MKINFDNFILKPHQVYTAGETSTGKRAICIVSSLALSILSLGFIPLICFFHQRSVKVIPPPRVRENEPAAEKSQQSSTELSVSPMTQEVKSIQNQFSRASSSSEKKEVPGIGDTPPTSLEDLASLENLGSENIDIKKIEQKLADYEVGDTNAFLTPEECSEIATWGDEENSQTAFFIIASMIRNDTSSVEEKRDKFAPYFELGEGKPGDFLCSQAAQEKSLYLIIPFVSKEKAKSLWNSLTDNQKRLVKGDFLNQGLNSETIKGLLDPLLQSFPKEREVLLNQLNSDEILDLFPTLSEANQAIIPEGKRPIPAPKIERFSIDEISKIAFERIPEKEREPLVRSLFVDQLGKPGSRLIAFRKIMGERLLAILPYLNQFEINQIGEIQIQCNAYFIWEFLSKKANGKETFEYLVNNNRNYFYKQLKNSPPRNSYLILKELPDSLRKAFITHMETNDKDILKKILELKGVDLSLITSHLSQVIE